jgi:hypothetical protein
MKLGGGGVGGWLFTFGRSLLILISELFSVVARQKIALRTNYLHLAYIKVVGTTARGQLKVGPCG